MNKKRTGKIILYLACDVLFIEISLLVAMSLWYSGSIPGSHTTSVPESAWVWWYGYMAYAAPVVGVAVFACFKMYNNLWKYASMDEILKIFVATTIVFVILYLFDALYLSRKDIITLARRFLFIAWMLDTILFTASRFGYRAVRRFFVFISHIASSKAGCRRVMVVGAGYSGYGVVRGLLHSKIRDSLPVLVVDDESEKNNTSIMGVRVIEGIGQIAELAVKFRIDEIIIAMPGSGPDVMRRVMEQCTATSCSLKIIPPMSDVSGGGYRTAVRDVNLSDLLYRDEVTLDIENISEYISGRTVLVTGGGGSIGSELCRQIAGFKPARLVVFDIYENTSYELIRELNDMFPDIPVDYRIGSVRDMNRLRQVFGFYKPQVVFHAAAHKHVWPVEESPGEAIKNNVTGTYNTAACAHEHTVERFVLISSDKAVNPPNVYGATKRLCELIVQGMAEKSGTRFMAVRFGNVLGSQGSMFYIWKRQIAQGGPVTVTHREALRYWMTISEACRLVLQAAGLGMTGRTLILDMGQPVKTDDLARNMIRLSGFRPDIDVKISYTGLLPGEKLKEELILAEEREGMQTTAFDKIFMTEPVKIDYERLEGQLSELNDLAVKNPEKIEEYLMRMETLNYRGRNDA